MNEKALEGLKKFRESGQKPVVRTPLEKLKDNPASLRASITAFCWLCEGVLSKTTRLA
jgi:aspartyl/asparaginyl beta-hydroxylase (cupin superfamily)